jgi:hypothetical protein
VLGRKKRYHFVVSSSMVCRLSAKPEGDSPQPAVNIIGYGLKV